MSHGALFALLHHHDHHDVKRRWSARGRVARGARVGRSEVVEVLRQGLRVVEAWRTQPGTLLMAHRRLDFPLPTHTPEIPLHMTHYRPTYILLMTQPRRIGSLTHSLTHSLGITTRRRTRTVNNRQVLTSGILRRGSSSPTDNFRHDVSTSARGNGATCE